MTAIRTLLVTAATIAGICITSAATASAAPSDDGNTQRLTGSSVNVGKFSPGITTAIVAHSEFLTRFPPDPVVPPHPIRPVENFERFLDRFDRGIENPD